MTFENWKLQSIRLRAMADRTSSMIRTRARATALKAGLDPSIAFLHAHNAMVGRDNGRPWPEVDYSLARKVLWLEGRSWEPHRIAGRISRRAWERINHDVR